MLAPLVVLVVVEAFSAGQALLRTEAPVLLVATRDADFVDGLVVGAFGTGIADTVLQDGLVGWALLAHFGFLVVDELIFALLALQSRTIPVFQLPALLTALLFVVIHLSARTSFAEVVFVQHWLLLGAPFALLALRVVEEVVRAGFALL